MLQHRLWLYLVFWSVSSFAQTTDSTAPVYASINENLFVNSQWKYTYTTHSQSNAIIHKADENYLYFVNFKYDYTYQLFLNDSLESGTWKLNKNRNEINYNFRNISWWRLASFTDEELILEFTMTPKSSYRYHFIRVEMADTPFKNSPNVFPDIEVNVADNVVQSEADRYANFLASRGIRYDKKKWDKRKKRLEKMDSNRVVRLKKTVRGRAILDAEQPKEMIQVELVGGGFYGGIDPVYRNMIVIKTDGRIIKEYQSELQGLQVSKHSISRENLEQLIAYIEQHRFFEFDQLYTCESPDCIKRLSDKPRPIALQLAITKGVHRKIITIPIWDGKGKKHALINYPKELDDIVQAILTIATAPH